MKTGKDFVVAKLFKRVCAEDRPVTDNENRAAIFGEVMNIRAGQWLLDAFFSEANAAKADVFKCM